MYCARCGVKLGNAEERCPLCGLTVYHPELERKTAEPLYPNGWTGANFDRTGLRFLFTVCALVAMGVCLFIDLLLNHHIVWSGFVVGGLATAYIVFIVPIWAERPCWAVLVPIDFIAIGLVLLYIDLAVKGRWYLSFAFPITCIYGMLTTVIIDLFIYVHKGQFYIFGGGCIAIGCSAMLVEMFLNITFHTGMFRWSLFVVVPMCAFGLFWILAGIIRPLGNALRKRIFI